MKNFVLQRHEDETGVSGIGVVAEVVEFSNGKAVVCWTTSGPNSVAVYDSIQDVVAIHGHNGKTSLRHWTSRIAMSALGDRMKSYEQAYNYKLPERLPVVIRLDGRNFHTLTAKAERPFDQRIIGFMDKTALALAKEIQGVRFGYIQSDEINLFVFPWNKSDSQAWFNNEIQKMVSLSAGLASAEATSSAIDWGFFPGKPITFDSRAFILPVHEVINYFIWRQKDWERNSLNMLASAHYSHKQLMGADNTQRHEMLYQKGINWNDLPIHLRRGTALIETTEGWTAYKEMPILSSPEGRAWFWTLTGLDIERKAIEDQYKED